MELSAKRRAKREYDHMRYLALREQTIQRTRMYRLGNPELARARVAACAKANPESARLWARNNREKVRASVRKWDRSHRDVKNAIAAKRRSSQIQRTPAWSDRDGINMIYRASEVIKVTWPNVEVDHVIPLNGKIVSGLHVYNNLQIIPARNNKAKGNLFLI